MYRYPQLQGTDDDDSEACGHVCISIAPSTLAEYNHMCDAARSLGLCFAIFPLRSIMFSNTFELFASFFPEIPIVLYSVSLHPYLETALQYQDKIIKGVFSIAKIDNNELVT